jgi:hypothetical protein
MIAPCSAPIPTPMTSPVASDNTQISGCPSPRPSCTGRIWVCITPITMPTTPRMEPTERSMLRVTMTSTMPVTMTATEAVCTDRFQRLRGVRNRPPEKKLKPTQMMASAPIMPRRRVSISVAIRKRWSGFCTIWLGCVVLDMARCSAIEFPLGSSAPADRGAIRL